MGPKSSPEERAEVFAETLAHDLEAPLRVIQANARLARGEDDPAKRDQRLKTLEQSAQQAYGLVNALRRFFMNKDDITRMRRDPIALRDVVTEAIAALGQTTDVSAITVGDDPEATACADPILLRQVLINLLGNAMKYARTDTPLTIQVNVTDEVDTVRMEVVDNGIGIPERALERIFEPMQRNAPATIEGTGLGLTICRDIVQAHGGKISVTSKEGEGSTFTFTIPKARPATEADNSQ